MSGTLLVTRDTVRGKRHGFGSLGTYSAHTTESKLGATIEGIPDAR